MTDPLVGVSLADALRLSSHDLMPWEQMAAVVSRLLHLCPPRSSLPDRGTRVSVPMTALVTRPRGGRKPVPVGTRRVEADGTVRIKTGRGWEVFWRVLGEGLLGRPLQEHERVMFLNGDPTDYRPSNIEVWGSVRLWPQSDTVTIPRGALEGFSGPEELVSAATARREWLARNAARNRRRRARARTTR